MKLHVYTVTWCPHCVNLLSYLDSEGISYENFDVDADDSRWKEALKCTHGKDIVPVVECNGQVAFGAFSADLRTRIRKMVELDR